MENKILGKIAMVFGISYIIFMVTKPRSRKSLKLGEKAMDELPPKDRTNIPNPTMSKEKQKAQPKAARAFRALQAYILAYNAGEPQEKLNELNQETKKELGVYVYRRRKDHKLVVADLAGKDIIVNND